jgi:hypothetical protein
MLLKTIQIIQIEYKLASLWRSILTRLVKIVGMPEMLHLPIIVADHEELRLTRIHFIGLGIVHRQLKGHICTMHTLVTGERRQETLMPKPPFVKPPM